MNFEPVNFMNSADAANIQVMNKAEEAKFKDYTDRVLADLDTHRFLSAGSVPNQMHNKALAKNVSRGQLLANAYDLSTSRGLAGTLPRGHPARNLSVANPLDLAANSQSQVLNDGLGLHHSPAHQIKPLLQTASSLRGVVAQEPQTTRHSHLGSRRGLWGNPGPVKARAFQENHSQRDRRGHNRSAKPGGIAAAGGVLYSSHPDHVHNLLGKNIVEESLMQASAPDVNHSALQKAGQKQLLERLGHHEVSLTEGAEPPGGLATVQQEDHEPEGVPGAGGASRSRLGAAAGPGEGAPAHGGIPEEAINADQAHAVPGHGDLAIQSNRTPATGTAQDPQKAGDALPAIGKRFQ